MIIYKITNLINNKIYIGQTTKTPEQRLAKHWSEAKCEINGTRPNNYFHNALIKYGIENFKIEILDNASTLEELNEKEIYWIDYYHSTDKSIGYNLMSGGKSRIKNEETKLKLSKAKKENWENPTLIPRMRRGLTKATEQWQKICKDNEIKCICENCKDIFFLPPNEARKRKYCSQSCANEVNLAKATIAASQVVHKFAKERRSLFLVEVEKWIVNNEELIQNCSFNKISTTLISLQDLASNYGFSDWRLIAKVICGNPSKKELLKYLKNKI